EDQERSIEVRIGKPRRARPYLRPRTTLRRPAPAHPARPRDSHEASFSLNHAGRHALDGSPRTHSGCSPRPPRLGDAGAAAGALGDLPGDIPATPTPRRGDRQFCSDESVAEKAGAGSSHDSVEVSLSLDALKSKRSFVLELDSGTGDEV